MDVTVKGMFWLLEAFRTSPTSRQFLLVGGDAAVGHFYYRHPGPVTERTPHMAYPGCYALSKVLEEVLLGQYHIQYGVNGCCLRAPWIMVEIGAILRGERRDRENGVGKVQAFAVGEDAAEDYPRHDPLRIDLDQLDADATVVEEQIVAGLHACEDFRVAEIDPGCITRRLIVVEHEDGTRLDARLMDCSLPCVEVATTLPGMPSAMMDWSLISRR